MALMFGAVNKDGEPIVDATTPDLYRTVPKAQVLDAKKDTASVEIRGTKYSLTGVVYYKADGTTAPAESESAPSDYAYAVGKLVVADSMSIEISPDTFPGTLCA